MNRTRWGLLVAVVAAVGTVGWGSIAAATTTHAGGRGGDGTTLRLTTETVQSSSIDLGKKGLSQGDEFLFAEDLFRGEKKVGTDGGVCTATRVLPSATEFQCVITVSLRRGQLTLQGLFAEGQDPMRFAITGGTGAYRDAGGYAVVPSVESTTNHVTLHVEDLS